MSFLYGNGCLVNHQAKVINKEAFENNVRKMITFRVYLTSVLAASNRLL